VGYINTKGNIVFVERKDGELGVPLTPRLRTFLGENSFSFAVEGDFAVVDRSERLMDFLIDGYEPPQTPVKASYFSDE
jgi:hypothetical protein